MGEPLPAAAKVIADAITANTHRTIPAVNGEERVILSRTPDQLALIILGALTAASLTVAWWEAEHG